MGLKPKKHSDIKKIKEKMKVKASKMDTLNELPAYTMIVSEGIKTEPLFTRDSGQQGRKERSPKKEECAIVTLKNLYYFKN